MTMTEMDDDDAALAGEYAIGLLEGAEAAGARVRLREDPRFAAAVADWRERLVQLDADTAEVAPPARVYAAIERRLFGGAGPVGAGSGQGAAGRAAGGLWRWLAGLGTAAALAVAVFVVVLPSSGTPPTLLANLASEDGALALRVGVLEDFSAMHVILDAGDAPEGRVLQLWAIAEGQAPVSLGVVESRDYFLPDYPRDLVEQGITLAVSEEPPGGSPTGQPTGAVLAAGTLEDV
ncbi:anti-sigma factor [Wenxinia saemankumensis]|uniref:Anti-sigma-K factor RskA n=1 Tax=Wenxinia saemankumensis TaxID=1447782 RepID=A0A1M6BWP2_9RHOB|nr:anti-sigma factor [Wenxinia saemankumensis]SHI53053.1 Anti-sigma-K factor RskA [Wenxinia saemankumensis]